MFGSIDILIGLVGITKIIGLLITVCAAPLGAPFWFDMLSKVTNIRSAGPKPQTKTDVVCFAAGQGRRALISA